MTAPPVQRGRPADGKAARRLYFDLLLATCEPGEAVELRYQAPGVDGARKRWGTTVGDLEQAVAAAAGANVWAGIHPRCEVGRSGDASVTRAVLLPVDLDGKDFADDWRTGKARAWQVVQQLMGGPLEPTMVNDSGRGWHLFWVLAEPLDFSVPEELAAYTGLVARLARALGGDPSIKNPERVMRVPGTFNMKEHPPLPTRVLHFNPARRYNPSDFDTWLPPATDDVVLGQQVELPAELEANLAAAITATGWPVKIKRTRDKRVHAVVLTDRCPYCDGGSTRARGTAHVTPLAGTIKCKRGTCEAAEHTGGVAFAAWAPRFAPAARPAIEARLGAGYPVLAPGARRAPAAQAEAALHQAVEDAVTVSRTTGEPAVLVVPPGWGKTTAALEHLAGDTDTKYALLMRSHHDLAEKRQQYTELGGEAKDWTQYVGTHQACHYPEALRRFQAPRQWRRLACPTCPHKSTCRAHTNKRKSGRVLTAAHAAFGTLSRAGTDGHAQLDGRVVFVDEHPPITTVEQFTLADVETLTARRAFPAAEAARLQLTGAANVLLSVVELALERMRGESARRQRYGVRWLGGDLRALLEAAVLRTNGTTNTLPGMELTPDELAAIERARGFIVSAGRVLPEEIPGIDGESLRAGEYKDGEYMHPEIGTLFRAVGAAGDTEAEQLAGTVVLECRLGKDGVPVVTFKVQRATAYHVPPGGALVVLDATGGYTVDLLRAVTGGTVHVVQLDVEPSPAAQVHRVWVPSKSAGRGRTCVGDGASERGARHLERVLADVHRHADKVLPPGTARRSAFLTHRPVAGAWNTNREPLGAFKRALGTEVELLPAGYYGREERATNTYRECTVFGAFGAPVANIGDVETLAHLCRLHGIEVQADTLTMAGAAATLVQSLGRARADQRVDPVVLWHCGPYVPPTWLGTDYVTLEVPDGRPITAVAEDVKTAAVELLHGAEVSSPRCAVSLLDCSIGQNCYSYFSYGSFVRMQILKDLHDDAARRQVARWWDAACEAEGAVKVELPTSPRHVVWVWPGTDAATALRLVRELEAGAAAAAVVPAAAAYPVLGQVVPLTAAARHGTPMQGWQPHERLAAQAVGFGYDLAASSPVVVTAQGGGEDA